jgi:hypothetical protein
VSGAAPPGATAATPDALTMPVLPVAGPAAFGGAPAGEAHPRVVDVLLPPGVDQALVLGSFDARTGSFARVPFVSALAPEEAAPTTAAPTTAAPTTAAASGTAATSATAPAAAPVPAPLQPPGAVSLSPNLMPRLGGGAAAASAATAHPNAPVKVVSVTDELVEAKGPVAGLQAMQFGRVVDGQGVTVARVMILRILDQGLLATAIAGKERITPGQVVLFELAPASPGGGR